MQLPSEGRTMYNMRRKKREKGGGEGLERIGTLAACSLQITLVQQYKVVLKKEGIRKIIFAEGKRERNTKGRLKEE